MEVKCSASHLNNAKVAPGRKSEVTSYSSEPDHTYDNISCKNNIPGGLSLKATRSTKDWLRIHLLRAKWIHDDDWNQTGKVLTKRLDLTVISSRNTDHQARMARVSKRLAMSCWRDRLIERLRRLT